MELITGKLTDFEENLFLHAYIKELKNTIKQKNITIGTLKSDIFELHHLLGKKSKDQ